MSRFFLVVVVALLMGSPLAGQAHAQQPPGSYQQSCGNIRFDGNQLSAVCADRSGRRVPTSLMVRNCAGGISNDNGQLTCEAGGGDRRSQSRQFDDDDDVPRRPRRDDRDDGYRDGYRGGGPRDDGYRGDNYRGGGPRDDGFRPRREEGRGGQLPGGSWRSSCRDASMRGPVLFAVCADSRGQFQQTSGDVRSCPSFSNRNGNLVCD